MNKIWLIWLIFSICFSRFWFGLIDCVEKYFVLPKTKISILLSRVQTVMGFYYKRFVKIAVSEVNMAGFFAAKRANNTIARTSFCFVLV